MIIILGLVVLIAAVAVGVSGVAGVAGVLGVLGNRGIGHALVHPFAGPWPASPERHDPFAKLRTFAVGQILIRNLPANLYL
jgi:hypothetical protein